MSQTTADEANQLRRGHLSLPDVIAQSVSVIAPAMSGGFLTYLAATKAGGATPLAYVLAAIGALFLGGVVSEFSKSMASAGSLYTYVANGWNKTAGFVLGWLYSIALLILGAAVLAGFGVFSSLFINSITKSDDFVPWWVFFLIGLAIVAAMSLFDIRVSTRTQLVIAAATVAVMVIAALYAIAKGGPNDKSIDFNAFSPSGAGVKWSGILLGLAFGLLSFTGFEAGAVLAEETSEPKRNIPRAIVGSVVVSGVFYVLVTYATSIGFGVKEATAAWPASVSGLAAVIESKGLGDLVLLAVALSSLICGLGVGTAATRFLYTMGREEVLPKALGKTHPTYKTPWNAIFVYIGLSLVLIFGLLLITSSETQTALGGGLPPKVGDGLYAFSEWATLATPMIMFCYLLLGIAGVIHGRATANSRLTISGILAAIVGALATYGSLYYSFKEAAPGLGIPFVFKIIPWVCLALALIGLGLTSYLRSSKPKAWSEMGVVFEE